MAMRFIRKIQSGEKSRTLATETALGGSGHYQDTKSRPLHKIEWEGEEPLFGAKRLFPRSRNTASVASPNGYATESDTDE